MKRVIYVQILLVAVLGLFLGTGCGVGKMINNAQDVTYKVKPEVLENIGGKVNVAVDATAPPKYFNKKAVMVLCPEIKCNTGGSVMLDPQVIVGEKESDLGYPVISKKPGGTVPFKVSANYIPQMEQSELNVHMFVFKAKEFKKIENRSSYKSYFDIKQPDYNQKLADGVIITSTRIKYGEQEAIMAHGYEKITKDTKSANYYFHVSSANYSPTYGMNKNAESKNAVTELQNFLSLGWAVDNVTINGWASPDGENRYNNQLSEHRAIAIQKVWEKTFKPKNITPVVRGNGQDWDGYTAGINASSIPDKTAALDVLKLNSMEERQTAIAKLVDKNPALNTTVLEPLRRAIVTITCLEPKFTDEELKNFSISSPSKLKEPEILYAATLYTNDFEQQYTVYKNAVQRFPKSVAANNNAAALALKLDKDSEAAYFLQQLEAMNTTAPEVTNNAGVLAVRYGNLEEAKSAFNKVKTLPEAKYNLGLVNIAEGNFTEAQGLLSGDKCTYALGLVQLETGKIDDAINTLKCCTIKNPETLYLTAVAYARKGAKDQMIATLKEAVTADPALKEVAKKDREFIKYFADPSFVGALK